MCLYNTKIILTTLFIFLTIIYLCISYSSRNNANEFYLYSEPDYTFPTNKLRYSGGFIDSKNCNSFCEQRYKTCQSYFPIGQSNWCLNLKQQCDRDCEWNNGYNK